MSTTLKFELNVDPNSNSITYKINDGEERLLLNSSGSTGDFTKDLKEIMKSTDYANFMTVYGAYKKQTSWRIPSLFSSSKTPASTQSAAEVTDNESLAKYRAERAANTFGGKTKSRRSHNANKTLKNRK